MERHQKNGITIIVIAIIFVLLALIISVNWNVRLSFMQNLLTGELRIWFFYTEDGYYIIDFATKYLVFAGLSAVAYGLLIYLGIFHSNANKQDKRENK